MSLLIPSPSLLPSPAFWREKAKDEGDCPRGGLGWSLCLSPPLFQGEGEGGVTLKKYQSLARELRRNPTDAESKLWQYIRKRQIAGALFKRQYCIGSYIADFCCPRLRIIVELDGSQHMVRHPADEKRSEYLAGRGYQVLRFWNSDVFDNTDGVCEAIFGALEAAK